MKLFIQIIAVFLLFANEGFANPVLLSSHGSSSLIHNDDVTYNCPTGYSQPGNSGWNYCYKVHTDLMNRDDAAARCKAENGTLASIGNAFINSYIYSLGKQYEAQTMWLGVECFDGNISTCVNDDNTKSTYTNFYPGQPASFEYCVLLYTEGQTSQTWATNFCHNQLKFVCEVPVGKNKCLYGWTEFQGLCFKKFQTVGGVTRTGAVEQCQEATGGDLATVNSKVVNDFITSLPCENSVVAIGLQCPNAPKKGDTSTCVWDDGTPFSYSNFAPGQPIKSSTKYCGMLFLLLVALIVIYIVRFYWNVSKYPKGPFPLPLVGNMLQVNAQELYLDINRFKIQYGDMVTLWFSTKPVVFLTTHELIKEALLTKGDALVDRPADCFSRVLMSVENGGLATSNGESWQVMRKTSMNILRSFGMGKNIMEHMVQEQVNTVIEHIEKEIDKDAAAFEPLILNMVATIMNQLLFGYTEPYDESESLRKFNKNFNSIMVKMTESIWPRASDAMPIIRSLPYIGAKAYTEMRELANDNTRLTKLNVKRALENYSVDEEPTCFVHAYYQQMGSSPYLTEDNLYNVCNDFFSAGTETTTTTMMWIITYMAQYPDIQEKIRQEIAKSVGFDRLPSMEDKSKLPFTQAVINEIQRHSNMFPTLLERVAVDDVTINDHTFPKGTSFMPEVYEVFNDETLWPNPEEFNPSRFLNQDGSSVNHDAANKISVFGMGKRACVGEGLARAETFIFTAALLQRINVRGDTH